jgi:hypothetical protein
MLFELLAHSGVVLTPDERERVRSWWESARKPNESLLDFLIRLGIIEASRKQQIQAHLKGYLAADAVGAILTDEGRVRLLALTNAEVPAAAPPPVVVPPPSPAAVPAPMTLARLLPAPEDDPTPTITTPVLPMFTRSAPRGRTVVVPGPVVVPPPLSVVVPAPPAVPADCTIQQPVALVTAPPTNFTISQPVVPIKLDTDLSFHDSTEKAPILPTQRAPQVGDILGKCRLEKQIGAGGCGVVFRAIHLSLDMPVAIKVLRISGAEQAARVATLRAEARLLARLRHPHLVRVLDFDESGSHPFFVAEFVDGPNLAELLAQRGRLLLPTALPAMRQTAQALAFAHQHGVVHRDVKPANILVEPSGDVKLTDLGLAAATSLPANADDGSGPLMWGGTAAYMAPEQFLRPSPDHRSDMYGLGVCFYQLLTGQLPFGTGTPTELMFRHVEEVPKRADAVQPDVPAATADVIAKLLAKKPDDRYQTYAELLAALDALTLDPIVPKTGWWGWLKLRR